jgi:hypothetical protein
LTEEKQVLAMEEKILYSLVNYLQKIDFLDTGNKVLPQRSSFRIQTSFFLCVVMLLLLNDHSFSSNSCKK